MRTSAITSAFLPLTVLGLCAFGSCARTREPDVGPALGGPARRCPPRTTMTKADVFGAKAAESDDPVAFAIPAIDNPDLAYATAAMDLLAENWNDARSERALDEMAVGGPKYLADGFGTLAGEAYDRLLLLRGRKEYASLMRGMDSPEQKMKAVRDAFAAHPDWLPPGTRPPDKAAVVSMLIETAIEIGGADATVLVAKAGRMTPEYARRYPRETLGCARQIGCRESCSLPRFLDSLAATQEQEAASVVREWLAQPVGEKEVFYLMDVLARLPGGRRELHSLLSAERPEIIYQAAYRLAEAVPTCATLEAISVAIERLEGNGQPRVELRGLRAIETRLQRAVENATQKGSPP